MSLYDDTDTLDDVNSPTPEADDDLGGQETEGGSGGGQRGGQRGGQGGGNRPGWSDRGPFKREPQPNTYKNAPTKQPSSQSPNTGKGGGFGDAKGAQASKIGSKNAGGDRKGAGINPSGGKGGSMGKLTGGAGNKAGGAGNITKGLAQKGNMQKSSNAPQNPSSAENQTAKVTKDMAKGTAQTVDTTQRITRMAVGDETAARDYLTDPKKIKQDLKVVGIITTLVLGLIIFIVVVLVVIILSAVGDSEEQKRLRALRTDTIRINKTGPEKANKGDTLRYTIQVFDSAGASDITVVEKIPEHTSYITASGKPHYDATAKTVTWSTKESFPDSPGNATFTIDLKALTDNVYVINQATATSNGAVGEDGLIYPPNLDLSSCKTVAGEPSTGIAGEYCRMPNPLAQDTSYRKQSRREWDTFGPQDWGSKQTLGVLYTIAQRWQQTYCTPEQIAAKNCKAQLVIHDITSSYHTDHRWGNSVDLTATTNGTDCAGSFAGACYGKHNALASVTLGQIIVDTGYMHTILFNGDTRSVTVTDEFGKKRVSSVNKEIYNYAKAKYPTRFKQTYRPTMSGVGIIHISEAGTNTGPGGHDDHMHLYIDRDQPYYKFNTDFYAGFHKSKLQICTKVIGIGCKL